MSPSQAESDAMAAFLASREHMDLMEAGKAWAELVKETEESMKNKEAKNCANQNNQA